MDLNLLPHLRALLECESVSLAASQLDVPAPSMRRVLQQFRFDLRDPLLEWKEGRFVRTEKAASLLSAMQTPLDVLKDLFGTEHALETGVAPFRIAISDRIAHTLIPRLLAITGNRVSVEVVADTDASVSEQLRRGAFGLWLSSSFPELMDGVSVQHLYYEPWLVLFGPDAPVESTQSLEGYLRAQHVGMSPARSDRADRALARLGRERDVPVRTPYFLAAAQLVSATPLLFTGPSSLVAMHATRPLLGAAPVPFEVPGAVVLVAWHERFDRDPRLVWVREAIRSAFDLDEANREKPGSLSVFERSQPW